MIPRTRLALLGLGRWGAHYARVLSSLSGADLAVGCDPDPAAPGWAGIPPGARSVRDHEEVRADPALDAAVIATPASSHPLLARRLLEAGKDVLVEKPLAFSERECLDLGRLAEERGRILMVAHTFLFHGAIRRLRSLVRSSAIGAPTAWRSARTHDGPIRRDVNAAWDLALHDVSIADYLFGAPALEVRAEGRRLLGADQEDTVLLRLVYPGGVPAEIHASWAEAERKRTIEVAGDRGRARFDALDPAAPLSLIRADGSTKRLSFGSGEPLRRVCLHFLRCIRSRRTPLSGAARAAAVARTLQRADAAMKAAAPRALAR